MMGAQLPLDFAEASALVTRLHASPERRIDITLARLADIHDSMPDNERATLDQAQWWNIVVIVSRIRGMERAEEEALGRPSKGLADAYDRVVSPGDHAIKALICTFRECYPDG